ncbi:MAG: hypothetical protein ACTS4V_00180 [Candidatus Hodgkinia cicadicola]
MRRTIARRSKLTKQITKFNLSTSVVNFLSVILTNEEINITYFQSKWVAPFATIFLIELTEFILLTSLI